MQGIIDHRPRTIMEVFESLPEGTLAEVIDNALYMSPAPTPSHQKIAVNLVTELNVLSRVETLGEVYFSPIDVYLDETSNAVQPDVLFFFKESRIKTSKKGLHGSPDLIIEILSPGNSRHDQVIKKNLYEKFGVKEYWIVDPETRKAIGYSLNEKTYVAIGEFSGFIHSLLLNSRFEF
jgi:Uma2 family endonuclease